MDVFVVSGKELVRADHGYRRIVKVLIFGKLVKPLEKLYSELGRGGYPVEQGFSPPLADCCSFGRPFAGSLRG